MVADPGEEFTSVANGPSLTVAHQTAIGIGSVSMIRVRDTSEVQKSLMDDLMLHYR